MEREIDKVNIVIYGAGAIGATLGGWLTQHYKKVFLLARGENAKAMKSNGLILYEKENDNPEPIPVKVIEDLQEVASIDVVVIVVKNYDLEEVAKDIAQKLGDESIIVALQNGIENQNILPNYFTKIIYGVIVMSAWKDEPGVFGNRGKGQIILGTINNANQEILEKITQVFKLAFPTKMTKKIQDAAHSKMILNLANSVFTIINSELKDDTELLKVWKIFIKAFLEGVEIIRAAGYIEHKLKGVPTWAMMKFAETADKGAALDTFKEGLKYYWFNSMAQDMVWQQKNKSELESLNGYLICLADSFGLDVPINRTIYRVCKEQFSKVPYRPLQVNVVWEEINKNLKRDFTKREM